MITLLAAKRTIRVPEKSNLTEGKQAINATNQMNIINAFRVTEGRQVYIPGNEIKLTRNAHTERPMNEYRAIKYEFIDVT